MAKYTPNYQLKKPEGNENYNVEDQNGNMDIIDSKLAELFTSVGNGKNQVKTAIIAKGGTVAGTSPHSFQELVNGVNSIVKGQGNAIESQVLEGVTFSNSDGTLRTGTMPNNGAVNITPRTTDQTIAAGYHNGSGKVIGDPDLVAANIKAGVNIFGVAGKPSVVDTADATAVAAKILAGDTAYVNGTRITGTMPNKGAVTITPGATDQAIPAGYHNGSGKVIGDPDLIPVNIKKGVSIFGVSGTSPEYKKMTPYHDNTNANTYRTTCITDDHFYCLNPAARTVRKHDRRTGTLLKDTYYNPYSWYRGFYGEGLIALVKDRYEVDIYDESLSLLHRVTLSTLSSKEIGDVIVANGALYVVLNDNGRYLGINKYDYSGNLLGTYSFGPSDSSSLLHPILYKNNIISMGNNATISVFRMDSNGINYSGYTTENQSTMIISAFINDYQL
ncbi:hypothetical protein BP422_15530 [Brevibacillus formosus]|uniref:Uncharacterized protein n=1 Tax=Brevibacillus formosus TaxID=54913 RepID=A0A220MJ11_9BACL|nr:hypothetical protein [Brevibacillus formosus]ASJ54852.1 hypothetical protein BP422_15530 [Brevibacillus formosus]